MFSSLTVADTRQCRLVHHNRQYFLAVNGCVVSPPLLLVPTGAGASSPDLMYQSRRYVTQVNESFVQQYGIRNHLRAC